MTNVIYKYGPMYPGSTYEYEGTPVYVGLQNDEIFLWCKLVKGTGRYAENPVGKVMVVATGEEFNGEYIGTVVTHWNYVWHVIGVRE